MSRGTMTLVVLGLLGAVGAAATFFIDGPERFFTNWLIWFLFLLTVGLGSLFIVALEHLVGSEWSVPLRRVSERLAIVALFSLPYLYPWTDPEVAANPIVAGKAGWLNVPFFSARLIVSLVLWGLCWWILSAGSIRQDRTGDPAFTVRARKFSAIVMIVFAFTLTNVAFDWISSLEPVWYSDMLGVYLFAGTFLAGLASAALGVGWLMRHGRLPGVGFDHVYNLGAYLFAFTIFWSYIAFAQYMLQWYANMPEEVFWYQKRIEGFWYWTALLLGLIHFVIPFIALVSRKAKGDPRLLARIAALLLAAHALDLFWLIFPVLGVLPLMAGGLLRPPLRLGRPPVGPARHGEGQGHAGGRPAAPGRPRVPALGCRSRPFRHWARRALLAAPTSAADVDAPSPRRPGRRGGPAEPIGRGGPALPRLQRATVAPRSRPSGYRPEHYGRSTSMWNVSSAPGGPSTTMVERPSSRTASTQPRPIATHARAGL